jgi:glutaredoxin-related protein
MYVEDGIIKALEVASYPNDPAGDDNPDVTLADNMLSHIPDLLSPSKEAVLNEILALQEQDVQEAMAAINLAALVLFVKPSCAFSETALEELMSNGYQPRVFKTTRAQKRGLQALTGKTSMPSTWCNGTYIGGCNDGIESWHGVKPLVASGTLSELLIQKGDSKIIGA